MLSQRLLPASSEGSKRHLFAHGSAVDTNPVASDIANRQNVKDLDNVLLDRRDRAMSELDGSDAEAIIGGQDPKEVAEQNVREWTGAVSDERVLRSSLIGLATRGRICISTPRKEKNDGLGRNNQACDPKVLVGITVIKGARIAVEIRVVCFGSRLDGSTEVPSSIRSFEADRRSGVLTYASKVLKF